MLELRDEWLLILGGIRDGMVAWREPRELARGLGRPVEAALDAMAEMHLAGWLDVWERDDGLVVTLSPRAAAWLGTHLVETRQPDSLRWSRPDEARRDHVRSQRCAGTALATLDPPDERAPELGVSAAGVGPPTLLVGVGLCPWPGPREVRPPEACPACQGARLGPDAYCLRCDRWGRVKDGASPRTGRAMRPQRSVSREGNADQASVERARRRLRRKALLKALAGGKPKGSCRKSAAGKRCAEARPMVPGQDGRVGDSGPGPWTR